MCGFLIAAETAMMYRTRRGEGWFWWREEGEKKGWGLVREGERLGSCGEKRGSFSGEREAVGRKRDRKPLRNCTENNGF